MADVAPITYFYIYPSIAHATMWLEERVYKEVCISSSHLRHPHTPKKKKKESEIIQEVSVGLPQLDGTLPNLLQISSTWECDFNFTLFI